MWRSLASNMLTFLVVALFLLGGVILWGQSTYRAEGPLDQAICVEVPRGSNMAQVSQRLADQGAVSNPALFRLGAEYADKSGQLKAGSFLVPPQASMEVIVDTITRGGANTCGTEVVYRIGVTRVLAEVRELDPATGRFVELAEFLPGGDETPADYTRVRGEADTRYRISLAEGVTSWQVREALGALDVLEGEIAEVPVEGTLAPDSYEIVPGESRADLIAEMQTRQAVRVAAAWAARDPDLPISTPEEMLVLASIIEKETGVAEERGQVASVFVNRLNRGMRLQTDPTVIYGVTEGRGVLGRGLRQSELRRATPWNTYVIQGLPPTPIANPGIASLQAAVQPEATDYVFFVADGTGGHAFAETLEQHNQNVARWRQIEAERRNN
ncbi:MAG: endolytic transglycosylase MltG [Marinibacterium sp.]|nr:endolytic transglycosylase MltG [Marinibacterium sp.]